MNKLKKEEVERRLKVWNDCGRSNNKAAKVLGLYRRTFDQFIRRYAFDEKYISMGHLEQTKPVKMPIPRKGKRKSYIITCAQNNTELHYPFWQNLKAFADHINAEILISGFTYQKTALNTKNSKANKKYSTDIASPVIYDEAIRDHITSDLVLLSPTLAFCANLQILPTAVNPVSGFHDYTGRASSIIPHPKVRMEPIGTAKDEPAKHLYTTGAVTKKNYIQQKAGQKAEFHHVFGALVVDVYTGDDWFVRQICANDDGSFSDVGHMVTVDGEVRALDGIKAIQWGDIHEQNIDPAIEEMFWAGGDSVIDTLKPEYQLFHDLVDGESHNPHERDNHHKQYENYLQGTDSIKREFDSAREFLDGTTYREWCQSIVVWSNHDEFVRRWLKSTDYRKDHVNARFILELECEIYKALEERRDPKIFETALGSDKAKVLNDDKDSYYMEGIQIPFHGHCGLGGSRGSVAQFAKIGAKTMTGHSHAAWWINGATSAGTCSNLDLRYNKGFSTWSHTFTVLLHGGKRQQITANRNTRRWR